MTYDLKRHIFLNSIQYFSIIIAQHDKSTKIDVGARGGARLSSGLNWGSSNVDLDTAPIP